MEIKDIKWEKFLGKNLTEKETLEMIKRDYWDYWRRGIKECSTGNTLLRFSNDTSKTIIEVFKRTKLGIFPKKKKSLSY